MYLAERSRCTHLGVAARAQRLQKDVVVDDISVLEPAAPHGRGVLQLLLLRELRLLTGDVGRVLHRLIPVHPFVHRTMSGNHPAHGIEGYGVIIVGFGDVD